MCRVYYSPRVSFLSWHVNKGPIAYADQFANQCISLSVLYRGSVFTEKDEAYEEFTSSYWSEIQIDVQPRCIFKPSKATDVSVLVLLSRLTQCPFAVKSGGHAAFGGASSIEGGITVSLEKLDEVTLSCEKDKVRIGPGNRWGDVYERLDKDEVTVTGGRVASVGTGGLTLGGGISFFSNLHGWACDNVAKFEVVTASGFIIEVTEKSHPDLYWALRGGGNNFGIVTAFTFDTIPLPKAEVWGGTKTFLENDFDAVSDAFAGVIADSPKDPNAGIWVAWLQNSGMKLAATELWYTEADGADAEIFDEFQALQPIADTTATRALHDYSASLNEGNPYGYREVYYGLTIKANAEFARIARDIFFEELPATSDVAGANPVLLFQGITENQIKHMSKRGGNALGLKPEDGSLYLIHVACWWEDASDDETVYQFISDVLTRIEEGATERGIQNDYIYMNYASLYEDVIANYGPDNVKRLKQVASKYDPSGVFQKLQPGHFKLDRAPVPQDKYWSGVRS